MFPPKYLAAAAKLLLSRLFLIYLIDRIIEESVADKIILISLVPTNEDNRQCPNRTFSICRFRAVAGFIDKLTVNVIPAPQVTTKTPLSFLGKVTVNSARMMISTGLSSADRYCPL